MTRVHDMGGRFGDGPVPGIMDTRVFHADWHGRAMAITVLSAAHGLWNIDTSRHARECIPPVDYARFSYYERWMAGLTHLLVMTGQATRDELRAAANGAPLGRVTPGERTLRAKDIARSQQLVSPYTRDSATAPRFTAGDRVRTLGHSPNTRVAGGHTRLPRYAQGREGQILRFHGGHVLPDSNAHGSGEAPEALYAVAFRAEELWGTACEAPEDEIVLDLWESYLEPVPT